MTHHSQSGTLGGRARAEKLSPERRVEIAREAAEKRWANRNPREMVTHEALPILPSDLQAFVAAQAKERNVTPSNFIERCVRAAKETLEAPDVPAKLSRSEPFKSRLKGDWKAP